MAVPRRGRRAGELMKPLADVAADKLADLVRDAFYEGCETMQSWNGVLGPMSQQELHTAWIESESRKQFIALFPTEGAPQ